MTPKSRTISWIPTAIAIPLLLASAGSGPGVSAQDRRPDRFPLPEPVASPFRSSGLGLAPVSIPPVSGTFAQEGARPWYRSELARLHLAPAVFWGLSAATFDNRFALRDIRNRFIPNFDNSLDDYLQYVHVAGVYGLNAAGMPGRHSVRRASYTLALGGAITAGTVLGLKSATSVMRPDGSTRNSWPSGHTATAFATATFYHKEYGQYGTLHSVAAYGLAGVTGIFRQLNNRHWLTDVFAGAGFGLWSANVAYYLMDQWMGDEGVNPAPARGLFDHPPGNPSFLNLKFGYARAAGDLAPNTERIFAKEGVNFAFEAAWFPSRWVGIGADLAFGVFPVNSTNLELTDPDLIAISDGITTEALGSQSIYIGPYFDFEVSRRLSLRAKASAGYWSGADGSIGVDVTDEAQPEFGTYLPVVLYEPDDTFGYLLGAAFRYDVSRSLAFDLYVDYNVASPRVRLTEVVDVDPATGAITRGGQRIDEIRWNHVSVGVAVSGLVR